MKTQRLQILLIEDHEANCDITRGLIDAFEQWQATLECAESYESGLQALRHGAHDVCLIDYRLGERNGLELLRQARAESCKIPLILLAARGQAEVDIEAIEAGASDYLIKDQLDAPLLERSIRYALEHTRTLETLRQTAEENHLMASAINSLRSGVLITDPRLPDNPIVYANPGFTALTGYSVEEVMGRNCRFLQGPDTDAAILQEIRDAVNAKLPSSHLLVNYRKDGVPFSNGLVIQPIFDDDGQLINFVGLLNDVSVPREQLRALAARLTSVREEERTQIAREVHDELGQALTGFKMDLAWLYRRLSGTTDEETARPLRDKIQSMSHYVDETIQSVRRIATQLRPALLDDLGLEAAIEWQLQEFEERTGLRCRFTSPKNEIEIEHDEATAMFRIFQETLTNVARHAQAETVEVKLLQQSDCFVLEVKDDGCGISARDLSNATSLGLLGMRERALLVGGEVSINGEEGCGTTVTLRVPFRVSWRASQMS